jgi:hypothetical protein
MKRLNFAMLLTSPFQASRRGSGTATLGSVIAEVRIRTVRSADSWASPTRLLRSRDF